MDLELRIERIRMDFRFCIDKEDKHGYTWIWGDAIVEHHKRVDSQYTAKSSSVGPTRPWVPKDTADFYAQPLVPDS